MKSDIISIAMGELQVAFDNEVMKAVRKVGIDVNKEELLKALELHRNLVHCGECKHENSCEHQVLLSTMWGEVEDTADIEYCSYGERRE